RARVRAVEVAEVVVARDLAAEKRALGGHARLEEGMADAVLECRAAGPLHRVADAAACADVVENRLARMLTQERVGEQRGEEVAVDELARVVDEEAAVRVAVPCDAQFGAGLEERL